MTIPTNFRLTLLTILFAAASFSGQAQTRQSPVVAREGFWVVETPAKGRQCTVRFYTNQRELIYEESMNRGLNIARRRTQQSLNVALEQAMFVWNATHKVPTDRQWVAVQFDKK